MIKETKNSNVLKGYIKSVITICITLFCMSLNVAAIVNPGENISVNAKNLILTGNIILLIIGASLIYATAESDNGDVYYWRDQDLLNWTVIIEFIFHVFIIFYEDGMESTLTKETVSIGIFMVVCGIFSIPASH